MHEHLPTDDFVAYHEARARGGVGLIVLEATAVDESGLLTSHTLGGYLPEIVDGYRRVAVAVRPHGTRLFVQLFHGGREQIASSSTASDARPSAVPSPRFRTEPRAARPADLDRIVEGSLARRRLRPRPGSTGSRSRLRTELAAAAEAAEVGHAVVLLERSDRLGGQTALVHAAPGTAEIGRRFVALFEGRLADAGVEVRFDTKARPRRFSTSSPTSSSSRPEHGRSSPISRSAVWR